MFLFAILEFLCIECFVYALASLVLLYSYVCSRTPPLLYPIPFFNVLLSWICYFASFPPQLQGPVIVCAVFAYPSFVGTACGPSMPQGRSDDTYFYR